MDDLMIDKLINEKIRETIKDYSLLKEYTCPRRKIALGNL